MQAQSLYMGTAFIAGILSFFSPCIVPLLPVYFSIFTAGANQDKKQLVIKSFLFVLGLSVNFVILGFGAGFLGKYILTDTFRIILGIIVIILGLHQTGLIKIRLLMREKKLQLARSSRSDLWGVLLLGFTFSFGWTPCIGPALGAILGLAASGNQAGYGGLLMMIFALGFFIPFMILAFFSDVLLKKVRLLHKHLDKIQIIGGIIIVIMGILLLSDQLNVITTIFV